MDILSPRYTKHMTPRTFFTGRAIGFLIVLICIGLFGIISWIKHRPSDQPADMVPISMATSTAQIRTLNPGPDPKNAEYIIEGQKVQLIHGFSEIEIAPDIAAKIRTRYFGNELKVDLNKDGREDIVFFINQEQGGSGNNYYVIAALNTEAGYIGTIAYTIGDRIAPQSINKGNGNIIIVNYADRAPTEPFATKPTIGKSLWLTFDSNTMQFVEVDQNFSGEADPNRMSLGMNAWTWISTKYATATTEIRPIQEKAFVLTFNIDKKEFSASTDCNHMGGKFSTTGIGGAQSQKITFSEMIATQMYCGGSQEQLFTGQLAQVESYHFTSRGELVFEFKNKAGTMTFR